MTFLVADAALHRHGPEHVGHGGPERLAAVEHDEHALLAVQAAVDEV